MNLELALKPLSILNAWCRTPYEQMHDMWEARSAIYAMKQIVIREAIAQGVCTTRIVAVERPCKTCKGTGMYEWRDWNDEYNVDYQDCRRCGATGKVTLRFAETRILGFTFHTPRPKAAFLAGLRLDWERTEQTDWTPEQPGRPLELREIITLLNELERAVCDGKMLRWRAEWRGSVFDYYLNFGPQLECFVCGRPARSRLDYGRDVYRPGLKWQQHICDACESRAQRWPKQWPSTFYTWGQWITEHPPWGMRVPLPSFAENEVVREWLARRGIVIGRIPPTDHGYWREHSVEVIAHRNGSSIIRSADSQDPLFDGYGDARRLTVPAAEVRGRVKLLQSAERGIPSA